MFVFSYCTDQVEVRRDDLPAVLQRKLERDALPDSAAGTRNEGAAGRADAQGHGG